MMNNTNRKPIPLFICNKDIQCVKQCGSTAASLLMQAMRSVYQKQKHQRITVAEFAEYEDIPIEEVLKRMA